MWAKITNIISLPTYQLCNLGDESNVTFTTSIYHSSLTIN